MTQSTVFGMLLLAGTLTGGAAWAAPLTPSGSGDDGSAALCGDGDGDDGSAALCGGDDDGSGDDGSAAL